MNTEPAERLFSFGLRLGVNTANRTFDKKYFQQWNVNSWGSGFDAGMVVNLNFRDYFTIQPGIFYESRSGNYAYAQDYFANGKTEKFTEMGHYRTYNLVIPVMASFRFNLSGNVRWIAEAGPYLQLKLKSTDNDKIQVLRPQPNANSPVEADIARSHTYDAGLKIGTGFEFKRKYSINLHYLAGFREVWNAPCQGGRNKAWVATVGYEL